MRLTPLVLAFMAAALLPLSAAANLLDDGNLSLATTGTQTSNSALTLVVNFPDGSDPAARFQTGFANAQNTGVGGTEAPGTGTGVWFRSFEGDQGNSGEPLADAELSQSIIAPLSGEYTLDFVAGREVNHLSQQFFVELSSTSAGSVMVDLNAAAIPDGNLGGAASPNPGGTPFSLTLPGVLAGDTVTVRGAVIGGEDTVIPGGQSAFLDSFFLNVPELTSAMLISLAAVGYVVRRRR